MYYSLKYRCFPKTVYHVHFGKWIERSDGGWGNFISTHSLGRARYYAKKAKLKFRQIDVRTRGKREPYVLKGSWL
jgi:hypothetical protein